MKNNFHILKQIKNSKVRNNYIFVDTETYSDKSIKDTELLTFRLSCSIFWNKDNNQKIKKTHFNIDNFWNYVENQFDKNHRIYTLYAFNTQFDFKILNGFNQLLKRDWNLKIQYVRSNVFILCFQKGVYKLYIYDIMNYFQLSLKELGKIIGLRKLDIDFNQVSNKELEIYCKRDTEIIFQFINKLISFLEKYDLSSLRATAGSLSFNIYRHKFYRPRKNRPYTQIIIHDWKRAIKLERESYKGGISDCFKLGKQENIYKMDINSMYSKEMRDKSMPIRLLAHFTEVHYNQKDLFSIYNGLKSKYGFIMDCTIEISKENAYILNRFKDKSLFAYGKFRVSLCTPELRFVEKYGKILYIHQLNYYLMKVIFKKFVNFFSNLKVKYSKENNQLDREFCKLILNTQYGKWGQKDVYYEKLDYNSEWFKNNCYLIRDMVKGNKYLIDSGNLIIYLGKTISGFEVYIINREIHLLKQKKENSKDAFVAISSFITSYTRMKLIKFLKIAKRKNVCYTDTDSLFVNQDGYNNLKINNCIDKFELGKLKSEGFGTVIIYCPKFYDFNNERKCKGIRKGSKLLIDNKDKSVYQVENWQKYKTDLRKGNLCEQIIKTSKKTVNKFYDKGKIDEYNNITPYSVKEIIQLEV